MHTISRLSLNINKSTLLKQIVVDITFPVLLSFHIQLSYLKNIYTSINVILIEQTGLVLEEADTIYN